MVLIPNQDIPEGVRLAIKNAKSLLEEAQLLYNNKRFARSTALAILAYEEIAKAAILRDKWHKGEGISKHQWEKRIKEHVQKAKIAYQQFVEGIDDLTKKTLDRKIIDSLLSSMTGTAQNMKTLRESCIYVDWDSKNRKWLIPISKEQANEGVKPAAISDTDYQEALAIKALAEAGVMLQNFENNPISQKILQSV